MKLLTLNTWGPPQGKHRIERARLISEQIKRLNPDLILLQEVYLAKPRQVFIDQLGEQWCYHHYYASGMLGCGLLTLSRFPIIDTAFHRFRLGGKPERINHGDYYVGKGIGLARIETPEGLLHVFNCHTHAQYDYWDDDNEYAVFTESNLYESARFIHEHAGDNPTVLAGDLNTSPTQPAYGIITAIADLADVYPQLHGKHDISFSNQNPYVEHENQCLDYVMVRNASADSIELAMTEHFTSGEALAYSDHYGLLATISFSAGEKPVNQDISAVLNTFKQRIETTLAEVEGQQMAHMERSVISLTGIFDGYLTAKFIGRISERLGKFLRRIIPIMALLYALYQVVQARVNMQGRKQVLQSLLDELNHQRKAKRLFDGRRIE